MHVEETYDIVIIGAGHAGCEAALAAARLGFETIMFTVSMDSVALMPCNPNIGGSSKGHLVREIDALGGEMGKNIDKTYIQSKMLNVSKGPAVHSLRAQADKVEYTKQMRLTLMKEPHLTLRQAEVTELLTEEVEGLAGNEGEIHRKVVGVKTFSGATYHAKAVVLCTGVYLKARCIYGDTIYETGPNGLMAATGLSASLEAAGVHLRRFKTGTPPRIDRKSVDFSKMAEQKGDEHIQPFSFTNKEEDIWREQISCWLTYTNEETHQVIKDNIDRSPLYSGVIHGTGPRYCPSIEDKIMKFPDKDRHQLFLEPEGEFTDEMYLDGMSSSMPEDVQYRMVHSVPGLENAKIVRPAYAIEYDCISATSLKPSLESKVVDGLFSAGQMNGSSGYEEAGAQGLIAGINAARLLAGKEPVVLSRADGYIGVLVDDLVTKETAEPYRMMTSRAEYRLLLRQDNADLRLTDIGHEVGLIDDARYELFCKKREIITSEIERLKSTFVGANKRLQEFLEEKGSMPIATRVSLADILKRPEMSYNDIVSLGKLADIVYGKGDETEEGSGSESGFGGDIEIPEALDRNEIVRQIEIQIKYEGYIDRQYAQVEHMRKLEEKKIPQDIDYFEVRNLRIEARQKLEKIRPESIGQASRISGVSPADISMLMLYLKK
ncbi:MAG: tRNA uridine-5-carboxymethylaminomethyl(34) synthesis enzyme MnmG [Eubacterium sp.]|nr:tRNA uridine-5-carboxymethylaminomethyl(34) synthesis enzyme MnmG [Eubacterium sp.]